MRLATILNISLLLLVSLLVHACVWVLIFRYLNFLDFVVFLTWLVDL